MMNKTSMSIPKHTSSGVKYVYLKAAWEILKPTVDKSLKVIGESLPLLFLALAGAISGALLFSLTLLEAAYPGLIGKIGNYMLIIALSLEALFITYKLFIQKIWQFHRNVQARVKEMHERDKRLNLKDLA